MGEYLEGINQLFNSLDRGSNQEEESSETNTFKAFPGIN